MRELLLSGVLLGTAALVPAQSAPRTNLALYQRCVADSDSGAAWIADFVTDGVVANNRRWLSSGAGPHWCEIHLGTAVELGSAHVFVGTDDVNTVADFSLQYLVAGVWTDIGGTAVTGNTQNQHRLTFTTPITTDVVRFYTTDAIARVREIALYAPNAGGPEPWATDYTLNLARQRLSLGSSSVNSTQAPRFAVDGFAGDDSAWVTNNQNGPHTIDIDLYDNSKVGSVHVHSGFQNGTGAIANASLQYWNGSTWSNALAFPLSNNTQTSVAMPLLLPVVTTKIRLTITDNGAQRLREICVFPYHDNNGYPLGTDAVTAPRPTQRFTDYHDDYYNLRNRVGGLSIRGAAAPQLGPAGHDRQAHYQVLLEVDTDTCSIRNRATGGLLEVQGASKAFAAPVVEVAGGAFTGMPHQLWRLVDVGSGYRRLVNVHSGYALEPIGTSNGAALIQMPISGNLTQHWAIDFAQTFPKKGLAGWDGQIWQVRAGWLYNWGGGTGTSLPFECNFAPMYWGDWSWDSRPNAWPRYHRTAKKVFAMTYNEPDNSTQANITVDRAIETWPRFEESRMPLVSPGMTHPTGSWSQSFMSQAASRGYRVDYFAGHWYANPNADAFMSMLQGWSNTFGKPIWLTEWSNVDWSGGGGWTYQDCFNFFAEVLYRMEQAPHVRRYSAFIFRGAAQGTTSDFYYTGTTNLTPIGEVYSAWDADTTVRQDKAYHIHCEGSCRHLRNTGAQNLANQDIYLRDVSTQWALRPGPNGTEFLESLVDGRRIQSDGTNITLVPGTVADTSVQWRRVPEADGWYYLEHQLSGKRLRDNPAGGLEMQPNWTLTSARFRFLVPHDAANAASFGQSCGNSQLSLIGTPQGGTAVTLRLTGGVSNAPTIVAVSTQRAQFPMDFLGMIGCWLNIDAGPALLGTVSGTNGPTGQLDVPLSIPPGYIGAAYAQSFSVQPFLNPMWLNASRGVAVHVW